MSKQPKFTKDSMLVDIVNEDKKYAQILMGFGLHCFGCPLSQMETLEEASEVHGIDLEFMLKKLNEE